MAARGSMQKKKMDPKSLFNPTGQGGNVRGELVCSNREVPIRKVRSK